MSQTLRNLLKDHNIPATALLIIALERYGVECLRWESEVLKQEISEDLDVSLSDTQADKLQAAITILTTDRFETDWHTFNTICLLFNNHAADFENFEPAEAEDVICALVEFQLIRQEDEDGLQFGDDVNAYAGAIFSDYGCCKAPDLFPTAIMPEGQNECDMTEKNEALSDLYAAKKKQVEESLRKVLDLYQL